MSTSKRQLAMVMDLNKCLGCHTCTVACKTLWTQGDGMDYMWFNTVNTVPGKGTPKNWETMGGGFDAGGNARPGQLPGRNDYGEAWNFNHDEIYYEGKGGSTRLEILGEAPQWGPNWEEDEGGGTFPNSFHFYLPRICNHCTHPACKEACPRQAIEKRQDDGIVTVDEDRCRGYRFCQAACPYKKIYFNHQKKVAQKCIFCFPRIDAGVAPACARQCPGRVRFVGYRDDPDAPIYKLVDKWKVALPLHPEYGTEPNVFYVPPIGPASFGADGDIDDNAPRIPDEYLVGLFGPKVLDALATVKAEREKMRVTGSSELMQLLIAYEWKDMFGGFDQDPAAASVVRWVE
ncbi:MAG: respiratory nitrate reductase subunit beta [Pseudomonadales bacterium]|nr:respiratory nitrate reductase subunit beta [Pseudomonadales bacterium]MBP6229030.1 respiratory nitrate reductase subunit beta [Pseudomonadales bacterium]